VHPASGAALRGATEPQVVRDAIEPGVTAIACRVVWPLLVTAVGITGPSVRLDTETALSCCGAVARVAGPCRSSSPGRIPRVRSHRPDGPVCVLDFGENLASVEHLAAEPAPETGRRAERIM
jgi:hypothetical protein